MSINVPLTITGNASVGGTLTKPKLNAFNITTTSGTTTAGTAINGVQIKNAKEALVAKGNCLQIPETIWRSMVGSKPTAI